MGRRSGEKEERVWTSMAEVQMVSPNKILGAYEEEDKEMQFPTLKSNDYETKYNALLELPWGRRLAIC